MLSLNINNTLLNGFEKKLPLPLRKLFFLLANSSFFKFLKKLFATKGRQKKLCREWMQALDLLEEIPVKFPLKGQNIEADYKKCIESVDRLLETLKESQEEAYYSLKQKRISLGYRIGKIHGGEDPGVPDERLYEKLKKRVLSFQNKKILTNRDLLAIKTTSQFANFAALLLENKKIFNEYANWVFRDGNIPEAFIEYPSTAKKLIDCNLAGRIGRINEYHLKIEERLSPDASFKEKVLTLPINGVSTSLLDKTKEIVFQGNYVLTLDQVFSIFKNKEYEIGKIEYLQAGIMNWNTHQWGYYDAMKKRIIPIDLTHLYWWEELPYFEILDKKEAEERFGIHLNGTCWCALASATRLAPRLDYENTHAFLEVAIPRGDTSYAVYSFGKVATKFPGSFLETLEIFGRNLHATLAYPDDNVYYSHRSYACHPFILTETQGHQLMSLIKRDFLKGRQGNFVYQIESENCAKWVHETLAEVLSENEIPEMFRMRLLDTEPEGVVSHIFKIIKKLPDSWQTPVLTFFHLPMGALKETWIIENGKKVCKSLRFHDFWKTGIVFLPAMLHKCKDEGRLPRASGMVELISHLYTHCKVPSMKQYLFKKTKFLFARWSFVKQQHQFLFEYRKESFLRNRKFLKPAVKGQT